MRSMFVIATLFALGQLSHAQQCPFNGIATTSFGVGTGTCAESVLIADLDTSTCRLDFGFADEPVICGNVFLTQNVLLAGPAPLAQPFALPAPFIPGSFLYVPPFQAFGPFPGGTASLQVPPQPSLIGQSLTFQSVPFFFSTIPHPGQTDIGASTGLTVTLN